MNKPHSPDGGATFELGAIDQQLRDSDAYQANGHTARTLVRVSDLRLVLVTMRAESHIAAHRAAETASVHVLSGRLRLELPERRVDLRAGQVLVMAEGLEHSVEASEDSAFLLTLGWSGS